MEFDYFTMVDTHFLQRERYTFKTSYFFMNQLFNPNFDYLFTKNVTLLRPEKQDLMKIGRKFFD